MKALSIRQPWAWAIAHMKKRFENRDWRTADSALPKTLAIHASKGMTRNEYDDFMYFIHDNFAEKSLFVGGAVSQTGVSLHTLGFPNFENMVRGAVIAVARPLRWVDKSKSKWFVGKYAIEFSDDVVVLPMPVACIGRLGFFELPDSVARDVEKQAKKSQTAYPNMACGKRDESSEDFGRIIDDSSRLSEEQIQIIESVFQKKRD